MGYGTEYGVRSARSQVRQSGIWHASANASTCQILLNGDGFPDCYIMRLIEPGGNGLILVVAVEQRKRSTRLLSCRRI